MNQAGGDALQKSSKKSVSGKMRVSLDRLVLFCLVSIAIAGGIQHSAAERIQNPVAEFSGLDKITGRITTFDVYIDETHSFHSLRVTPRICNSRPPTEEPKTVAFVEVDEVTLTNETNRIFTGWMFVASPALNAVEHGIYDVWLTDCKRRTYKKPPENYAGLPVEVLVKENQLRQEVEVPVTDADSGESESIPDSEQEIFPIPKPKPKFFDVENLLRSNQDSEAQ